MALPALGAGSALGFGEQVAYDTAVARTNWLLVTSISLKADIERAARPHLGVPGQVSSNSRDMFTVSTGGSGGFEWIIRYNDSSILLCKHALGAVATVDLGGPGPYEHSATLATPQPTGLTIEQRHSNNRSRLFTGCKFSTLELSLDPGGLLTGRADVIAKSASVLQAATAATINDSAETVKHWQVTTVTWNGNPYKLTSARWRVNSQIARRDCLGSTETAEPAPTAPVEVTGEVTIEWLDDTIDAAFHAGDISDLVASLSGTGNHALEIALHNAILTDVNPPVANHGIISQTCTFRGLSDGTDEGLTVKFTNDNASALAN